MLLRALAGNRVMIEGALGSSSEGHSGIAWSSVTPYPRYVNSFWRRAAADERVFLVLRRVAFGVMNDFFFFRPIITHLPFSYRFCDQFYSAQYVRPWRQVVFLYQPS
jgi:hypothetical protein